MHEQRSGWAPPLPRGQRCPRGRRRSVRPPLAGPPRPGPEPRTCTHLPGSWVTRHRPRVHTCSPVRSSPRPPGPDETRRAWASSLSFAPRSYPQRTSGRGLATNTGQELRHRQQHAGLQSSELTRNKRPRVARPQPSHYPRTAALQLPSTLPKHVSSQRENHQRPNKNSAHASSGHDISAAINSPGHRQGHGLSSGLETQEHRVLTCRRPPSSKSAVRPTR
jgi:hypothetical protein